MRTATRRPSTRRNSRGRKGFSLVELLVAMILIAIVMWPMLTNFLVGARGAMKTGDVIIATNLCAQALEIVRNKPFQNLLPGRDPLLLPKMDERAIRELVIKTWGEMPKEYQPFDDRFERELELEPIEEKDGGEKKIALVKVIVHCRWKTKEGKPVDPLVLCTLVANESARFGD